MAGSESVLRAEKKNIILKWVTQKVRHWWCADSGLTGKSKKCPSWQGGQYSWRFFYSCLYCTSCNRRVNKCKMKRLCPVIHFNTQDDFCPEWSETSHFCIFKQNRRNAVLQCRSCRHFLGPFVLGSWTLAGVRKRVQHSDLAFPSLHLFFCFKQHVFVYLEIAIEEQPVGRLLLEVCCREKKAKMTNKST